MVLVIVDDCPGVEGSWTMIDVELAEIGIEVGYPVVDVHSEIEGSWSWTIDVTLVEMEIEVGHGYLAGYCAARDDDFIYAWCDLKFA